MEGAFQALTDVLRREVGTLGYPRAALSSFAVVVLAYNAYAVVRASLHAAHGAEAIEAKKLARYPKKRRVPKKPQPRKKSGRRNHHVSTARVLLKRRKKRP